MNTRTDNPVTLTHEQAERVSHLLGDYATSQRALAHRTRSDAVRGQCNLTASEAQQLARRGAIEDLGPQQEYTDNTVSETLVTALEVVREVIQDKQEAV